MALISKILETTLAAGQTSVVFTDAEIPNSLLRVFCTNSDIFPASQTLSGTSLTVTYESQSSNVGVALEIVKAGLSLENSLTSSSSDAALTAAQGKALKDALDDLSIPDEITDLSDVSVSSIQNGQVLAWNSDTEKFENVNASGDSEVIYSTTERKIGKWIDNSDLYEITCVLSNIQKGYRNVSHGLTGISAIRHVDWAFYNTASGGVTLGHDDTNANWWCDLCYVDTTNVIYMLGTSWTDPYNLVMTIRYSKSS